jgi:hypothetical protein
MYNGRKNRLKSQRLITAVRADSSGYVLKQPLFPMTITGKTIGDIEKMFKAFNYDLKKPNAEILII